MNDITAEDDDDGAWQDQCFRLLRLAVAIEFEHRGSVDDPASPLAWAMADLKLVARDLFDALIDGSRDRATFHFSELRTLAAEIYRLGG